MTPENEKKLNEVHAAIVGNEAIGHKGLIPRMQDVEKYQDKDRRFKNKLAGGFTVGTPVVIALWEWIKYKFF